mmetsp:Transcript_4308/g.9287  ORF Transcript_4308/g.9287 Transcript_4308/m.9287 type:complete len:361 (-) Transcript_4308:67-1149(-)
MVSKALFASLTPFRWIRQPNINLKSPLSAEICLQICHYHSSSLQQQSASEKSESGVTDSKDTSIDPVASSNKNEKDVVTTDPSNNSIFIQDRVKIIRLERGIAHVQLSRPDKLNSLDIPMFEAIADAAARLREENKLRAVIISGEGRAFCTGLDAKSVVISGPSKALNALLERPSAYGGNDGLGNLAQDVCYLWRQIPVPVIAAIHGMCFGGGLQIALGADMRYCTPDCKLSIMESRWGLIPDMGASVTLRELVRIDVAKELTMTGRIISGVEAEKIGLVTRCVEDPMEEALKVAEEIAERSPDSVASTKELFQSTWVADEDACLRKETDLQMKLIGTWNQIAASGRQFGAKLPYYHGRK